MIDIGHLLRSLSRDSYLTFQGLCLTSIAIFLVIPAILTNLSLPLTYIPWITVSACLINVAYWHLSQHITAVKKGRIGFLISIYAEEDIQKVFKRDFIQVLKDSISSSSYGDVFDVKIATNRRANKLKKPADAHEFHKKNDIHFVLYGAVKKRKVKGKDTLILDLDAVVRHKHLRGDVLKFLRKSISSTWTKKYNLTEPDRDYSLYEITSEHAAVSAVYMISLAAFCSMDPDLAESLTDELKKRIEVAGVSSPVIYKINKELNGQYNRIFMMKANILYQAWMKTHEKSCIAEMALELNKIKGGRIKKNIDFAVLKAIELVVLRRDFKGALQWLNKSKANNAVWFCNMAFLYAGLEEHSVAISYYVKASKLDIEFDKVTEFEDFMHWHVETYPCDYFVYFLLGQLNYSLKGDNEIAKSNYILFLDKADKTKDKLLIRMAKQNCKKI